ncbi:hypothetical protein B0I31_109164 [Saccharothrix carnea]|uniref:Uncharacterized protein n=2 Tax=Saccharothrix carnea TaxID=1280637 RepID=A0A2P8I4M1_SACCR|nr:hypothetical protein B0I31_109164 [Saccharothrix carnea]
MDNRNVAGDHSFVGKQVGFDLRGSTLHSHNTTYHVNRDDPPEWRFKVALSHLNGGVPREAEKLLRELVLSGRGTSRMVYYYALSVVSERSLNEVDPSVIENFDTALHVARNFPVVDAWRVALDVVRELMSCIWRQASVGQLDADSLQRVLNRVGGLPGERQKEITRHLNSVLGGAIQDHLAAVDAQRILFERREPDRVGRAWKFFEPEPAQPRRLLYSSPPVGASAWAKLAGGGLLVAMGLLTLFGSPGVFGALLPLLLTIAGGYLTVRFGVARAVQSARLVRKEAEHGFPYVPQPVESPGHWVPTDWVRGVHEQVEAGFRDRRPHVAGDWSGGTAGLREHLKGRLVAAYGNAQVSPASLNWLIRWHADQAVSRWRAGTFLDYREALRPSTLPVVLFRVGVALAVVGPLVLAGRGMVGVALLLGAGAYLGLRTAIAVLTTRQVVGDLTAAEDALSQSEQEAYTAWLQVLADRPDDEEMATWLALDKSYLKTVALERAGLTNRDLIDHVVMTQGAPDARRARVPRGPVRYSEYVVLIFLLTRSGVREIEVDLNFLDGSVRDERRTSFRYEALASAKVAEAGTRVANGERNVVQVTEQLQPLDVGRLRSRQFALTLNSGEVITAVVENFQGLVDPALEDPAELVKLAMDTSGVTSALRTLEAVAAEGRDWVALEQERRKQRLKDGAERNGGLGVPGGGFAALEG